MRVAPPGVDARLHDATASAPTSAAPYVLTVATLEPRKNLGTARRGAPAARRGDLALAVAGGEGWGEQPELDRPGRRPARLRRTTTSWRALYRGAAVFVYPSRFEGFGHPGRRGDGLRRAGRRLVAPVAGRGLRRRGRARRSRESGGDRRGDRASRSTERDELVARGLAHARALHVGATRAGSSSTATLEAARDARRPRRLAARQTRAGTARYIEGCSTRSTASTSSRLVARGSGRIATVVRDAWLVPGRPAATGEAATARRAPLPDLPRAGAPPPRAAGRHRSRPRRPAAPRDVQPLDAALQPLVRASGGAGGEPGHRRLRVHEARARRAARRAGGEGAGHPERRRRTCSRPTGRRPTATTCSPSGRSSRARTCRASQEAARRPASSCASSARAAGAASRPQRLARTRRRRRARAPLPGRAVRRLPVAVRGLRPARARGDGLRGAGRHEPRAARRRRSPAAPRCSSTRTTRLRSPRASPKRWSERDELRRLGLERARAFTWDAAARATADVYRDVAG